MKSLYVGGSGFLYRLSPKLKLGGLAVLALALFFTRNPALLGPALLAAALVYFNLHRSLRAALQPLKAVLATIVLVALFNLIFTSREEAIVTVLRLTALVFMAASVTATTTIGQFIDTVTKAAAPLEKIGLIKAADIGLAVGLVLRFVPEILSRYEAIREAHRARGLAVRPLTMLGPLMILTLKDADNIAAAIDARGIRGQ
ncbi:energy-coupling factor transporter transmembrane protein EcfT [Rhizobium sp. CG5]|uniref:energy-coupling factor transporter transmembrane component T family protein n=1 Tax=Rhizobium sp. CG5 TaxID=2726076 RepID=UPI0020339E8A|nr:energy-coupling factor transporter transmembrane protein EcfT [Rhizobium sp. CG5]MCM2476900.1 energy-coupling factor transporter transmembrane protein EcfT [Rhizobium sp. CG5]